VIITLENFDQFLSILHCCKQEEMFYIYDKNCPPRLHNILTLPSDNENITFHTFIMHSLNMTHCIKHGVKHKVHQACTEKTNW